MRNELICSDEEPLELDTYLVPDVYVDTNIDHDDEDKTDMEVILAFIEAQDD